MLTPDISIFVLTHYYAWKSLQTDLERRGTYRERKTHPQLQIQCCKVNTLLLSFVPSL